MSLSTRIAMSLCGVVLLYGALAMLIQKEVIAPGFVALEREEATEDMARVLAAIQREIDHLDTFCHDWSAWDDTCAYVRDKTEAFETANLTDSTFADYFLNLIYILNTQGEVVWGKIMDFKSHRVIEMEEFPTSRWAITHPLLQHSKAHDTLSGILVTHSGPMLIASRPIVNSESTSPIQGTLIMGRLLDDEGVRRIGDQALVGVKLTMIHEDAGPGRALASSAGARGQYEYKIKDAQTFQISSILADIYGQAGLQVEVSIKRDIMARGQELLRSSTLLIFASGLIALVVALILLRRSVVRPLLVLTGHVARVGKEEDFTALPLSPRRDEIGTLSHEFNRMVGRIQHHAGERSRAESALRESETRLRTIIATAPDGIITVSAEGHVESFNPAAERLFGYAEAEVLGRHISVLMPGNPSPDDSGIPASGAEGLGRRRDGSLFPLLWTFSETLLAGQPLITGMVRDISMLKEMHEKMLRSEHLAAIGEMGASMAHEIRNPLAGISGAVQVLRDGFTPEDARRETMDEVLTQVGRVEAIVRRLLLFAKPWAPRKERVDLRGLVERVSRQAQSRELYAGITFRQEGADALESMADSHLLEQVLWNILGNAADALRGREGGAEVVWTFEGDGDWARIRLKDNGVGIPASAQEQIFHPFFTTKTYGTGLGLLISRRILEAHGGSIGVSSVEHEGTEVTLELPKGL